MTTKDGFPSRRSKIYAFLIEIDKPKTEVLANSSMLSYSKTLKHHRLPLRTCIQYLEPYDQSDFIKNIHSCLSINLLMV
jgi:hypothetical protein